MFLIMSHCDKACACVHYDFVIHVYRSLKKIKKTNTKHIVEREENNNNLRASLCIYVLVKRYRVYKCDK